jgi:methionine-gamma-lyase
MKGSYKFATTSVHAGSMEHEAFGSLATPIYQTATFYFDSAEQGGARFAGQEPGYIYTRLGNPTTTVLEEKIAALENGEAAAATSSGIGAITAVFWTLVKAGDHIVADKTLYGCTFAFLNHGLSRFGVETTFVDTSDLAAVKGALRENTKVVYFESPANPNMKVVDVKALADLAHGYNPAIKVVMDNTFNTPYILRPLDLGCDVVIHSGTKYLNGHGDVISGLIISSAELMQQIKLVGIKDMNGSVMSPNDAALMIRGLKTLDVRMERHCKNGMAIAKYLEQHPKVKKVYYPGLESFEGHEVAAKQCRNGFGGILAFEIEGGLEDGKKLINSLQLCTIAVSLGDCETLIQHPASMTHSPYTAEERAAAGISDSLIRLSVGLEDPEDLIADFEQAFARI